MNKIIKNIFVKKPVILLIVLLITNSACQYMENNKAEPSQISTQTERYIQDVAFISKMPRLSGELQHKKVQQLCVNRLHELGFQVELHDYGTGINVVGTLMGTQKPAEKIVLSAHYDTVPGCNGADDNASGVAGVFATAKLLVSKPHHRTLVVACWDEEEKKTVGSKAYVLREKNNNSDIKISYVYEMIGYKSDAPGSQQIPGGFELLYPQQVKAIQNNQNRGDFIAFIYDDNAADLLSGIGEIAKKNRLSVMQFEVSSKIKTSPVMADLRRSDHSAFWDADYPAVMITDTANFRNQNYHCLKGADNSDSLDVNFALKTINTLAELIAENLE